MSGMVQASRSIAPPDVPGAGPMEWASMGGLSPESPLVGGPNFPGLYPTDVDRGRGRVVTVPGAGDPAHAGGVGAPGLHVWDDWRDLFNFKGSPMPWLLLLTLAMLGFASLAISGRVGPVKASGQVG